MELNKGEIEALRNSEKGGFTEESIALLIHDKAPDKVKYWADRVLEEHRREEKAKAKERERYLNSPVPYREYHLLEDKIVASVNPLIANVYITIDILQAKGIITDEERAAFSAEDKCVSCTSVRPPAGGYCPEVLTRGGGRVVTTQDAWPSVKPIFYIPESRSIVDKVLQCSLYEKKIYR